MDDNEYLGGRTPEQDEASDDVDVNPEAGVPDGPDVPPDRDLPAEGEEPMADPGAERARMRQAGL